jgi:hypothetical protein
MRESRFERQLVDKLEQLFPNCVILKNDSSYLQGVPDRLILHNDRWAMLEVKASATAPTQPNQPYYIDKLNEMSFAAFVYPENEQDVLDALQFAFGHSR